MNISLSPIIVAIILLHLCKAFPRERKLIYTQTFSNSSFPYLIQMRTEPESETICTGALVLFDGRQIVLTSATCVLSFKNWNNYTRTPKKGIKLIAGNGCNPERRQIRSLTTMGYHSRLDYMKYENDIAIVNFDSPYHLNDDVQPIALPNRSRDTNGILVVPKWERGRSTPTELQLKVISDAECSATPGTEGTSFNHLCALRNVGSNKYCYENMDRGAPAVFMSRGRRNMYLAGIAVFNPLRVKMDDAQTCVEAEFGVPNVFSEVANHMNWIRETVRGSQ